MGEDTDWKAGLQDLFDQVQGLTSVQWGYAVVTAAAVFLWIWVMGAPKEQRLATAGAVAVIAGVGVSLAIALYHARRLG